MMKNFWEDPQLVEAIAEELHKVWMGEKLAQGWTYGPVKDNQKKTHPSLVPYKDLPEEEKELDRMFVREIPKLLQLAGISLERIDNSSQTLEKLARSVHSLWLEKRRAQGWTKETDPHVVDYEELPESSKELNRKAARTALELLRKYI
ncbi:MAG: RyR domain-containing protein [Aquificaceae bacterium]